MEFIEQKKIQFTGWIFKQLGMKELLFRVEYLERENERLRKQVYKNMAVQHDFLTVFLRTFGLEKKHD